MNPHFVSPQWLADRLGQPGIAIVDASWYLPAQNRNARAEYNAAHIPGAVFFDIDTVADTRSGLPHMLPSPEVFSAWAGAQGISETDDIVVYDGAGLFSAARAWWTFSVMGAKSVFILEGGMPAWQAAGLPVSSEVAAPIAKPFKAQLAVGKVKDLASMRAIAETGTAQIADARPADRFAGLAPEPRPGLRSGHMPGAASVPSSALVADGKLRPASELRAIFESAGIDLSKPVATSCGSGVTAAILTLALDTLGHTDHALYDGSWAEWGLPGETPVVLGAVSRAAGGPDRTLTAHITELEMDVMPSRRTPLPSGQKISLMRTSGMTPEYYAFLYEQVGRPHHWFVRRNMPDAMLKAELESGKSEIWVLHADGCPAGFFEIGMEDLPEKAEIRLLGLLPAYQGRGLSKFLISEAVFAAWAHNPQKVAIETNTLDSPRALVLYQKAGFHPVGSRVELVEPWV